MKRVRLKHGDQSHGYITLSVCLRRLRSAKVRSILTLLTHAVETGPQYSIVLFPHVECRISRHFSNKFQVRIAIFLLRVPALVPRAVIADPFFGVILGWEQPLLLESRQALRMEPAATARSVATDPLLPLFVVLAVVIRNFSHAFIAVRLFGNIVLILVNGRQHHRSVILLLALGCNLLFLLNLLFHWLLNQIPSLW